jgi:hypothetical protein
MTEPRTVASIFRGDIGAAWARAEERLGEYWRIRSLTETRAPWHDAPSSYTKDAKWEAVATDGNRIRIGSGLTPAAALDDIAADE